MHIDPIMVLDGAASTLLTIQPDLVSLVEDILRWDVIGQFCLTELGRGLDIFRMKTSATLLPRPRFMPPTVPVKGLPCIAIVFAQLYVNGECRGPRPFLVNINDGYHMCNGVTSRLLPPRGGSAPVNHALTSFHHVCLPPSALLGDLDKSNRMHRDFMSSIWRVCGRMSSYIAARYFQRRHVTSVYGNPVPILSYRTQQLPLLHAIAQAFVLGALYKWAIEQFMDKNLDVRARHGVAACCKAVMVQHAQFANCALSERMGAQGLFEYNRLSNFYSEMRGISIAEGDILGLVGDTLAQTYTLPLSTHPDGPLALHEISLFDEATETVSSSSDFTQAFMQYVQPRYRCRVVRRAWYIYAAGHYAYGGYCFVAALPRLDELLAAMEVEPYVTSPIISDECWRKFSRTLPVYSSPQAEEPAQPTLVFERARL
ncbi:acyl-CoA dehydrogenase NM domain-like protein [Suillus subalutaceus]|uniref:acyl-CoA dehydrogenase NM domain-like protein n=1 Tax=Suillus subalutaceus TaxID=48586 RepID=UPI001B88170B|nr:acyl-CoA dehydrogenase NM domain-like protein [Suillus subalutaceus]KAG1872911.1 acyl-CoA dehydrogenase NM domain-like protein [Suillus subalutaceus]